MKRTNIFTGSFVPTALIIAGCLCIAVSVVYEAINYPWQSLNPNYISNQADASKMRDPPPLEVPFISYSEYKETLRLAPEGETDSDSGELPVFSKNGVSVLPGDEVIPSAEPVIQSGEESQTAKVVDYTTWYVWLGIIKIPVLNVSEHLFEGTGWQLYSGTGHLEDSAMPGEEGNCVIAGHRTSSRGKPFKYLDKLLEGDLITIEFDGGTFTYEVFESFIVAKEDVWVLNPIITETHLLTLVTCDPLITIGSRPNRLIVRARLIQDDTILPPEDVSETYN